jgi:ABC-type multidrug transport system ATPase subunit
MQLNARGVTIFLSSHLLAEVEQMCTRVGVLDRGRLVLEAELAALRAPTGNVVVQTPDVVATKARLGARVVGQQDEFFTVAGDDPAALNAELVKSGIRVESLAVERRTLEEVILEATGPGSDRMARTDRRGA